MNQKNQAVCNCYFCLSYKKRGFLDHWVKSTAILNCVFAANTQKLATKISKWAFYATEFSFQANLYDSLIRHTNDPNRLVFNHKTIAFSTQPEFLLQSNLKTYMAKQKTKILPKNGPDDDLFLPLTLPLGYLNKNVRLKSIQDFTEQKKKSNLSIKPKVKQIWQPYIYQRFTDAKNYAKAPDHRDHRNNKNGNLYLEDISKTMFCIKARPTRSFTKPVKCLKSSGQVQFKTNLAIQRKKFFKLVPIKKKDPESYRMFPTEEDPIHIHPVSLANPKILRRPATLISKSDKDRTVSDWLNLFWFNASAMKWKKGIRTFLRKRAKPSPWNIADTYDTEDFYYSKKFQSGGINKRRGETLEQFRHRKKTLEQSPAYNNLVNKYRYGLREKRNIKLFFKQQLPKNPFKKRRWRPTKRYKKRFKKKFEQYVWRKQAWSRKKLRLKKLLQNARRVKQEKENYKQKSNLLPKHKITGADYVPKPANSIVASLTLDLLVSGPEDMRRWLISADSISPFYLNMSRYSGWLDMGRIDKQSTFDFNKFRQAEDDAGSESEFESDPESDPESDLEFESDSESDSEEHMTVEDINHMQDFNPEPDLDITEEIDHRSPYELELSAEKKLEPIPGGLFCPNTFGFEIPHEKLLKQNEIGSKWNYIALHRLQLGYIDLPSPIINHLFLKRKYPFLSASLNLPQKKVERTVYTMETTFAPLETHNFNNVYDRPYTLLVDDWVLNPWHKHLSSAYVLPYVNNRCVPGFNNYNEICFGAGLRQTDRFIGFLKDVFTYVTTKRSLNNDKCHFKQFYGWRYPQRIYDASSAGLQENQNFDPVQYRKHLARKKRPLPLSKKWHANSIKKWAFYQLRVEQNRVATQQEYDRWFRKAMEHRSEPLTREKLAYKYYDYEFGDLSGFNDRMNRKQKNYDDYYHFVPTRGNQDITVLELKPAREEFQFNAQELKESLGFNYDPMEAFDRARAERNRECAFRFLMSPETRSRCYNKMTTARPAQNRNQVLRLHLIEKIKHCLDKAYKNQIISHKLNWWLKQYNDVWQIYFNDHVQVNRLNMFSLFNEHYLIAAENWINFYYGLAKQRLVQNRISNLLVSGLDGLSKKGPLSLKQKNAGLLNKKGAVCMTILDVPDLAFNPHKLIDTTFINITRGTKDLACKSVWDLWTHTLDITYVKHTSSVGSIYQASYNPNMSYFLCNKTLGSKPSHGSYLEDLNSFTLQPDLETNPNLNPNYGLNNHSVSEATMRRKKIQSDIEFIDPMLKAFYCIEQGKQTLKRSWFRNEVLNLKPSKINANKKCQLRPKSKQIALENNHFKKQAQGLDLNGWILHSHKLHLSDRSILGRQTHFRKVKRYCNGFLLSPGSNLNSPSHFGLKHWLVRSNFKTRFLKFNTDQIKERNQDPNVLDLVSNPFSKWCIESLSTPLSQQCHAPAKETVAWCPRTDLYDNDFLDYLSFSQHALLLPTAFYVDIRQTLHEDNPGDMSLEMREELTAVQGDRLFYPSHTSPFIRHPSWQGDFWMEYPAYPYVMQWDFIKRVFDPELGFIIWDPPGRSSFDYWDPGDNSKIMAGCLYVQESDSIFYQNYQWFDLWPIFHSAEKEQNSFFFLPEWKFDSFWPGETWFRSDSSFYWYIWSALLKGFQTKTDFRMRSESCSNAVQRWSEAHSRFLRPFVIRTRPNHSKTTKKSTQVVKSVQSRKKLTLNFCTSLDRSKTLNQDLRKRQKHINHHPPSFKLILAKTELTKKYISARLNFLQTFLLKAQMILAYIFIKFSYNLSMLNGGFILSEHFICNVILILQINVKNRFMHAVKQTKVLTKQISQQEPKPFLQDIFLSIQKPIVKSPTQPWFFFENAQLIQPKMEPSPTMLDTHTVTTFAHYQLETCRVQTNLLGHPSGPKTFRQTLKQYFAASLKKAYLVRYVKQSAEHLVFNQINKTDKIQKKSKRSFAFGLFQILQSKLKLQKPKQVHMVYEKSHFVYFFMDLFMPHCAGPFQSKLKYWQRFEQLQLKILKQFSSLGTSLSSWAYRIHLHALHGVFAYLPVQTLRHQTMLICKAAQVSTLTTGHVQYKQIQPKVWSKDQKNKLIASMHPCCVSNPNSHTNATLSWQNSKLKYPILQWFTHRSKLAQAPNSQNTTFRIQNHNHNLRTYTAYSQDIAKSQFYTNKCWTIWRRYLSFFKRHPYARRNAYCVGSLVDTLTFGDPENIHALFHPHIFVQEATSHKQANRVTFIAHEDDSPLKAIPVDPPIRALFYHIDRGLRCRTHQGGHWPWEPHLINKAIITKFQAGQLNTQAWYSLPTIKEPLQRYMQEARQMQKQVTAYLSYYQRIFKSNGAGSLAKNQKLEKSYSQYKPILFAQESNPNPWSLSRNKSKLITLDTQLNKKSDGLLILEPEAPPKRQQKVKLQTQKGFVSKNQNIDLDQSNANQTIINFFSGPQRSVKPPIWLQESVVLKWFLNPKDAKEFVSLTRWERDHFAKWVKTAAWKFKRGWFTGFQTGVLMQIFNSKPSFRNLSLMTQNMVLKQTKLKNIKNQSLNQKKPWLQKKPKLPHHDDMFKTNQRWVINSKPYALNETSYERSFDPLNQLLSLSAISNQYTPVSQKRPIEPEVPKSKVTQLFKRIMTITMYTSRLDDQFIRLKLKKTFWNHWIYDKRRLNKDPFMHRIYDRSIWHSTEQPKGQAKSALKQTIEAPRKQKRSLRPKHLRYYKLGFIQEKSRRTPMQPKKSSNSRRYEYEWFKFIIQKKNLQGRRLRVLRPWLDKSVHANALLITKLPVLPPEMRPFLIMEQSHVALSDVNKLYLQVMRRVNGLRRALLTFHTISDELELYEDKKKDTYKLFEHAINRASRRGHRIIFGNFASLYGKDHCENVASLVYHQTSSEVIQTSDETEDIAYSMRWLQRAVNNLVENGKSGFPPVETGSEENRSRRPMTSIADTLKGKKGRFRQNLLGKRVDYSGRSVIAVGPELQLHQCGLPEDMAFNLFRNFLLRHLIHCGDAMTMSQARQMIYHRHPLAYHRLREVLANRPVVLNRAPTLHRLGMEAFQPLLITGKAILLHPLVCSAFNADFDGDQMAVHLPITIDACVEAWNIMCSCHQHLSMASGESVPVPSQDMVLGCFWVTTFDHVRRFQTLQLNTSSLDPDFNSKRQVYNLYHNNQILVHCPIWLYMTQKFITDCSQPTRLFEMSSSGSMARLHEQYKTVHFLNSCKTKLTQKSAKNRVGSFKAYLKILHLSKPTHFVKTTPGRIILDEALHGCFSRFRQQKANKLPPFRM